VKAGVFSDFVWWKAYRNKVRMSVTATTRDIVSMTNLWKITISIWNWVIFAMPNSQCVLLYIMAFKCYNLMMKQNYKCGNKWWYQDMHISQTTFNWEFFVLFEMK
jgi:hypothetical protein